MRGKKFFFLLIFMIAFCGTFGGLNLSFGMSVQAANFNASVWNGDVKEDESDQYDVSAAYGLDYYNSGLTYNIYTAKGMAYVANLANQGALANNSNIYLETDLNWNNKQWIAIGNSAHPLQINFYGQGHFIYNLAYTANENYIGLFGCVGSGATINKLHVRNFKIGNSVSEYAGGLVAHANGTVNVVDSTVFGMINSTGDFVGGLVGQSDANVSVTRSQADVTISSKLPASVGGLVGSANYVSISRSSFVGSISAAGGNVGGLVGNISTETGTSSTIVDSYNVAEIRITGSAQVGVEYVVGGLVGSANTTGRLEISTSYNSGNISAALSNGYYAGFVGSFGNSNGRMAVTDSFAFGTLPSAEGSMKIDAVLANGDVTTANNVYTYCHSGNNSLVVTSENSNTVATLPELTKTAGFFQNTKYWSTSSVWNFSIWQISSSINNGLPYIEVSNVNNEGNVYAGFGTQQSPYLIFSAGDLSALSAKFSSATEAVEYQNKWYSLQNDISLVGQVFTPIGLSNAFSGVFDGNGHTISGLTVYENMFQSVGLFARTENAVIKNLIIDDFRSLGSAIDGVSKTGTLIGEASPNTYIINCVDKTDCYYEIEIKYNNESKYVKYNTVGAVQTGSGNGLTVAYGANNIGLTYKQVLDLRKFSAGVTYYEFDEEQKQYVVTTDTLPQSDKTYYNRVNAVDFSTIKLSSDMAYKTAYDIAISAEGGNFFHGVYDTQSMYEGQYHILLDNAGNVVRPISSADTSIVIDTEFGNGNVAGGFFSLPSLSKDLKKTLDAETDALIKPGFELTGYTYSNGDSVENSLNLENALAGLKAVWAERTVNMTIVYNKYEADTWGTGSESQVYGDVVIDGQIYGINQGTLFDGDDIKYVYLQTQIGFDTYLSDLPAQLFSVPSWTQRNEVRYLRDGLFDIENFYIGFKNESGKIVTDFQKDKIDPKTRQLVKVEEENGIEKQNFSNVLASEDCVLFAKWKGLEVSLSGEEISSGVKFKFVNSAGEDMLHAVEKIEINVSDKLDTVNNKVIYVAGDSPEKLASILKSTKYSDSTENSITFKVWFKDGFTTEGSGFKFESQVPDSNFGLLSESADSYSRSIFSDMSNPETPIAVAQIEVKNLISDVEITYQVEKAQYHDEFFVQGDFNIGVGAFEKVKISHDESTNTYSSNMTVEKENELSENVYIDLLLAIGAIDEAGNVQSGFEDFFTDLTADGVGDIYVGFDLKLGKILFSTQRNEISLSKIFTVPYNFAYFYPTANTEDGKYVYVSFAVNGKFFTSTWQSTTSTSGEEFMQAHLFQTEAPFWSAAHKNQELVSYSFGNANKGNNQISYTAFGSFILIAETSDGVEFKNYGYSNLPNGFVNTNVNDIDHPTSVLLTFDEVTKPYEAPVSVQKLSLISRYTEITFELELVDEDGNLLSKNLPIAEFADGVNTMTAKDLNSSITINVTASEFYKLLGNENGWRNMAVSVSNCSADNDIFETEFNGAMTSNMSGIASSNLANYFNIEIASVGNVDYRLKFTSTAQTEAGLFTVKLIFTDRKYYLSTTTLTASYDTLYGIKDAREMLQLENAFVLSNSAANTGIGESGATSKKVSDTFKFDDQLVVSTDISDFGLAFYGWLVQTDKGLNFVRASSVTGETLGENDGKQVFSEFYLSATTSYNTTNENSEDFIDVSNMLPGFDASKFDCITVAAVFLTKHINLSLFNNLVLQDKTGSYENEIFSPSTLSLKFSLSDETQQISTYQHEYSSTPQTITVSMGGLNANGYHFTGFNLVDRSGNVILPNVSSSFDSSDFVNIDAALCTMQIDMSWIDENITNHILLDGLFSGEYFIQPIITQKEIQIKFHSAAAEGNFSVFDAAGNETTNNIYVFSTYVDGSGQTKKLYYGASISASGVVSYGGSRVGTLTLFLVGADDTLTEVKTSLFTPSVANMFKSRTGYRSAGYYSYENAGVTYTISATSTFYITSSHLAGRDEIAVMDFYVAWTSNKYTIVYANNSSSIFGAIEGSIENTAAEYDGSVTLNPNAFSVTGYTFAGWSITAGATEVEHEFLQADVLETNAFVVSGENFVTLLKALGVENMSGSVVNLYAVWHAREYEIQFFLQGGKFEEKTEFVAKLSYNQTFDKLLTHIGETEFVGIDALTAQRAGFTLQGFFADSGVNFMQVQSGTAFNTRLITTAFGDEGSLALTLYARWIYDNSVTVQFSTNLITTTYNGQAQRFSLADFFANATLSNISYEDGKFSTTIGGVSIEGTFTNAPSGVMILGDSFSATDAGTYNLTYTITITDLEASDMGKLQVLTLGLVYQIFAADITLQADENALKFASAIKLMSIFDENAKSVTTVQRLFDLIVSYEGNIVLSDVNDICDYVIVKYYLMLHTNSDDKMFRNWTYHNFSVYASEDRDAVEIILKNSTYFAFFEPVSNISAMENADLLKLVCEKVTDVNTFENEVEIEKVVAYSDENLAAQETHTLRVYLVANSKLSNYAVGFDGEKYYVDLGEIYIMPKPLYVANDNKQNSVYYSSVYEKYGYREADWSLNSNSMVYERATFFEVAKIENNSLYATARLYTSSVGEHSKDTQYAYSNTTNYLYFSGVQILLDVGGSYVNHTNNFKLMLNDSQVEEENRYVFTITRVTDVICVEVKATYLTIQDNLQYNDVIDIENPQLDADLAFPTNIMYITKINYVVNGRNESFSLDAVSYPYTHTVDGVQIFEIRSNNLNSVLLYVGNSVTSVEVESSSVKIGDYINLYAWQEGVYTAYGVGDNTAVSDSYTLHLKDASGNSRFEIAEDDLTIVSVSAIFTDLVRAEVETGFGFTDAQFLRLGETTAETLSLPKVSGFTCVNLISSDIGLDILSQEGQMAFFAGANGEFVGLDATNPRQKLTFKAYWKINETSATQLLTDYSAPVSSFTGLRANDVAYLNDIDDNLFNYTYVWMKYNEDEGTWAQFCTGEMLTLNENGSVAENGQYKLCLLATIKDEYISALAETSLQSVSSEVELTLTFVKHQLISVVKPEVLETEYTYQDIRNTWGVAIEYLRYSSADEAWTERVSRNMSFTASGDIFMQLLLNGQETTEMRNAGTYSVNVCFNADKFDVDALDSSMLGFNEDLNAYIYTFEYVITPYALDISSYDFNKSKIFNSSEDDIFSLTVKGTEFENVAIKYNRVDKSEDVGEYQLFLASEVVGSLAGNYVVTYKGVEIYKYANITTQSQTTPIGTFTINNSTTLQLQTTKPEITLTYTPDGYSAKFVEEVERVLVVDESDFDENGEYIGDFDFENNTYEMEFDGQKCYILVNHTYIVVTSGSEEIEKLEVSFFDAAQGQLVSNEEILKILRDKIDLIEVRFLQNSTTSELATDAGTYSFVFTLNDFEDYYSYLEFATTFTVAPYAIDVSDLDFSKVYDGLDTKEYVLEGYGLTVVGTYTNIHVGEKILVTLDPVGDNLGNFTFSSRSTIATITKRSAQLAVSLSNDRFVYGQITKNNTQSLFESFTLLDGETDLTSIAFAGYYNISLSLDKDTNCNSFGYLYAGIHDILVTATFNDFEITNLDEKNTFEISIIVSAKTVDLQISANYITINTTDTVEQSYAKTITVDETGDSVTVYFAVTDADGSLISGVNLDANAYPIVLLDGENGSKSVINGKNSLFVISDSVLLVMPESNIGFTVVQLASTLFVSLDDESVLTQTYDGTDKRVSLSSGSLSKPTLNIGSRSTSLTFMDNLGNVIGAEWPANHSLSIDVPTNFNGVVKNVGTYVLNCSGTVVLDGATYNNIIFGIIQNGVVVPASYSVVIEKIEIDITQFEFTKGYDGSKNIIFTTFAEMLAGDSVSLIATFEDANIGSDKNVTLSLSGASSGNYVLSAETAKGKIEGGQATISATKTTFTYGELIQNVSTGTFNLSAFMSVTSNGNPLIASQYALTIVVQSVDGQDVKYSEMGYLFAGTYNMTVTGEDLAGNYHFNTYTGTITVNQYALEIVFTEDGEISVEEGMPLDGTSVSHKIRTALSEEAEFVLKRNSSSGEIGNYRILSGNFESLDGNYLATVVDNSENGAFAIVEPAGMLYLLVDEGNRIENADVQVVQFEYNGATYDNAVITENSSGTWQLVISSLSSPSAETHKFNLALYALDMASGVYTKHVAQLNKLSAALSFVSGGKDVGRYEIVSTGMDSSPYTIRVGKNGQTVAFGLQITQKALKFKTYATDENGMTVIYAGNFMQVFNNKTAEYTFEDAAWLLDGVALGDDVALHVQLYSGANLAKYVESNLGFTATIENDNYRLFEVEDENGGHFVDTDGNIMKGEIIKATATLIIDSQGFEYGRFTFLDASQDLVMNSQNYSGSGSSILSFEFDYGVENFNLGQYKLDGRSINWEIYMLNPVFKNDRLQVENGNAGNYTLQIIFVSDDFNLTYLIDGAASDTLLPAVIKIKPATISLRQTTENFSNIFNRKYDGTNDVAIFKDGILRFALSGILSGDDVSISGAKYSDTISRDNKPLEITFTLAGQDAANYQVEARTGTISNLSIGVVFENSSLEDVLTQLSYPFANVGSLSANGNGSFPTVVSGKPGSSFVGWTLNFENLTDSQKFFFDTLPSNLKNLLTDAGYTSSSTSVNIPVADNSTTLAFLQALLEDSTDAFGCYYFKNHNNIAFVFTPNWSIEQVELKVQITNESNYGAAIGAVAVWVDGKLETTIHTGTQQTFSVDYGSEVLLKLNPNEHYAYNTVLIDGKAYYDYFVSTDEYKITPSDNNVDFTINSFKKSAAVYVQFKSQTVNVKLNLAQNSGVTFNNSSNSFVSNGDGTHTWATTYVNASSLALADLLTTLNLSKYGYTLSSQITANGQTCFVTDRTLISSFVTSATASVATVEITPSFDATDINIVLDYGYNNISKTLTYKYEQQFKDLETWEESPLREGFNFAGWFTMPGGNGTRRVGNDFVPLGDSTLYASWRAKRFTIVINLENASLSGAAFGRDGNVYTAPNVEFGSMLTFTLLANEGYEIDADSLPNGFQVLAGAVLFEVTNFGEDGAKVEYSISAKAKINTVTLSGEHLDEISVTDEFGNDIEIENGAIKVKTGDEINFRVTAAQGWKMSGDYAINGRIFTVPLSDDAFVLTLSTITDNSEIMFFTTEKENAVTLVFDDKNAIDALVIDGKAYTVSANVEILAKTNHVLTVQVYINGHYNWISATVDNSEYSVSSLVQENIVNVSITVGTTDGQISVTTQGKPYVVSMEVVNYDENGDIDTTMKDNAAYVSFDGKKAKTMTVPYNSDVTLTFEKDASYHFAGWRINGEVISYDAECPFTVTENVTIYAHFTASSYKLALGTLEYSVIEGEDIFKVNEDAFFTDGDEVISELQVFYGASLNVQIHVPTGFEYYGYGYLLNGMFTFLNTTSSQDSVANVVINTSLFGNLALDKIYLVIRAYSVDVQLVSQRDIDGNIFLDDTVGVIELCDENGVVAENGHIFGSRVQYNQNRTSIISYTNEDFFVKVSPVRDGYVLKNVSISGNFNIELVSGFEDVFHISGLIGGVYGNQIVASFRPILNTVDIRFVSDGVSVDGGSLTAENVGDILQIWSSASMDCELTVSAYTDSRFFVTAYVRAGFLPTDWQIIASRGIVYGITFSELSIEETGFVGKIEFFVSDFTVQNEIKILLKPNTYTVLLKEEDVVLAKISNVIFGQMLDLSQNNSSNIEILDSRIHFTNGSLNLVINQNAYNFVGYFTYQNGAGVQYINSLGAAVNAWAETGFAFNSLSSKYEIADNSFVDEDGNFTVSLFIYQSYLKTRLQFEIVPSISSLTAKDMITGVDSSNSWFYSTSPNCIEVAFNTNINITAPEVAGFKFYQFQINQRLADGNWLTEVVTYSSSVPWASTKNDNIVEVDIKIVYFAQVDVEIVGGEGGYTITQNVTNDATTLALLSQGYVDPTQSFVITAEPAEGYDFVQWNNLSTGATRHSSAYMLSIAEKVMLQMQLEGKSVVLDFASYDAKHGQITTMEVLSPDGSRQIHALGAMKDGVFVKSRNSVSVKVGDVVTFYVSMDEGFAVSWNLQDVSLDGYSGRQALFTYMILPEVAETTVEVEPSFDSDILTIFVSTSLEKLSGAIDNNSVLRAISVKFDGVEKTFISAKVGENILIELAVNDRYAISNLYIATTDKFLRNTEEFVDENGNVLLSDEFLKKYNITGSIQLVIELKRLMWESETYSAKLEGLGTANRPYLIYTAEDLALMMQLCNSGKLNADGVEYGRCSYMLMNDISLNEEFWAPIGTFQNMFGGTFNFNGHTVKNIYFAVMYSKLSYGGLFGYLSSSAQILAKTESMWWIWLIIAIAVVLVCVIVVVLVVTHSKKKRQEEMSKR